MNREVLIPVRLELQTIGEERLNDYFLWDLHESRFTPEQFARQTSADLDLSSTMETAIAQSIRSQLSQFSRLDADDGGSESAEGEEKPLLVKLDITIAGITLRDQVEWSILPGLRSLSSTSPETFAAKTVREIGLPREFLQAIAFSIREQIANAIKPSSSSSGRPFPQRSHQQRDQSELLLWGPMIIPASAAVALPGSVMVPIVSSSAAVIPSTSSPPPSPKQSSTAPPVSMSQFAHPGAPSHPQ